MKSKDLEKKHFSFSKGKTRSTSVTGFFWLAGGFIIAFANIWWGYLMLIPGVLLVGYREGVIVDLNRNEFIDFKVLLGIKIKGTWRSMDEVEYLSLVRVNIYSSSKEEAEIDGEVAGKAVKLNMVFANRKYLNLSYGNKEELLEIALAIGKMANLKIFDVTSAKKNWIYPDIDTE